ncbi:uncharacterized protein BO87DRAFT_375564 [Aspergillus neoniger CBS 115656]|uniref:Uncharacterized protein n=1 Tax=Aspergillus neoniger (strain CBS 115656) TaxID=1448310 RepID=A0A318YTR1_ASPNB|nr:hypothetical protein BO87DRAFT_375564 [Aspergillus neoniger CBS 115656]PYH35390.1 hypothetical protein BO87DRAFT_375564 [Aspergillus neoniger CBS 115656]
MNECMQTNSNTFPSCLGSAIQVSEKGKYPESRGYVSIQTLFSISAVLPYCLYGLYGFTIHSVRYGGLFVSVLIMTRQTR